MFIRSRQVIMLKHLLAALVPLLISAITPHAIAGQLPGNTAAYQSLIKVADRAVSMGQAIDSVRRTTGGRVLDAQDAGSHYRIKVLTRDGEVRVMNVDASTGRIQ